MKISNLKYSSNEFLFKPTYAVYITTTTTATNVPTAITAFTATNGTTATKAYYNTSVIFAILFSKLADLRDQNALF